MDQQGGVGRAERVASALLAAPQQLVRAVELARLPRTIRAARLRAHDLGLRLLAVSH